MDRRLVATLSMLAMLGACVPVDDDPRQGTQIGDEGNNEGYGCEELSRDPIADEHAVADGFAESPAARWATVEGRFTGELALDAGGAVDLAVTVEPAGAWELVRSQEREHTGDGDVPNIYVFCPDAYERPARITLVADGHLDEVVETTVALTDDGAARWMASIPLEDLVGGAAPGRIDPAGMDRVWLDVGGGRLPEDAGWEGDLAFLGEATSGGQPEGGPSTAIALTNDPYGRYAVQPE